VYNAMKLRCRCAIYPFQRAGENGQVMQPQRPLGQPAGPVARRELV
jgi:hypothetical protein